VEYYKKNIENAFPSLMNTDSEGKNLVATGISSEVLDKIEVINLVLNTKNENQMFLNNDVKKALSRGLVQGVANEKEMLNIKESLSTVNKNKM
jgi:hypothetical protein